MAISKSNHNGRDCSARNHPLLRMEDDKILGCLLLKLDWVLEVYTGHVLASRRTLTRELKVTCLAGMV